MSTIKSIIITLFLFLFMAEVNAMNNSPKSDPIDVKVDSLLKLMTLKEKIGQLNQYTSQWEMTGPAPAAEDMQNQLEQIKTGLVGSMLNVTGAEATKEAQKLAVENSRLGIPLVFGYDVIHGYRTLFPIPLAEAASWEPALAKKSASIAAKEASAAGIHWTFAPMVDISRDARWGRVMEGAGEDPYLGSLFAAARVKGFQGDDLSSTSTVAACAKHFAAYGFIEAGRDYNSVDISNNTLHNTVLPPFKAAADAGAASFMNAFNVIGGIPATMNTYLLRDILKGEWEYDGMVVSDWNSVGEIIKHGVAPNKKEAAKLAIIGGCDMDMEGRCYVDHLEELVAEGTIDEALINDAAGRVLKMKFELGLFDDPYQYSNTEREKEVILSAENLAVARDAARKSIVLLKNEQEVLPLAKSGLSIAVMGELAEDKDSPIGSWRASAIPNSAVSLIEGIKGNNEQKNDIQFTQGIRLIDGEKSFVKELNFNTTDRSGFEEAKVLAQKSDVVVMALGENCFQTGEGRSQTDIRLKGLQMEFFNEIYAVNPNIVVVLMNGRPVVLGEIAEKAKAILEVWHLGLESGNAIADVLFGDFAPSGKLPVSFPVVTGQAPIYYNHLSTGRPDNGEGNVFWSHYTDAPKVPLYPFGYGLTYTNFEYSDISLDKDQISFDEFVKVTVQVKNTGKREGTEVVQLYIHDLFASVARPVKELKAFKKVTIPAGESKEVTFSLTPQDLAFYNIDKKWTAEPGDFKVFVGTNSRDVKESHFKLVD
ncbi:beta-glucosidase BglX [uncultured Sunxiuqinia sp.]|uniref:beta-glucosidase BglX n=1 Tax=uncultured Sunxiuqinia sp. TaxID=1573825 RepID=UPI002AA7C0AB|nr:beta-glucosidase BglX [uncultured Sunxiuqinia sp.]